MQPSEKESVMQKITLCKWMAAFFSAAVGTGMLSGAEVMKIESASDFTTSRKVVENAAEKSFAVTGAYATITSKPFQIDPSKKYRLSGKFRAAPGTEPQPLYFGFVPLDGNGKQILAIHVNLMKKGTESELAAPLAKGDKIAKVKDASKWNGATPWGYIAFNVKEDGSDLPNSDLLPIVEKKIEKKGDVWEVTLKNPAAKDYPAGTKVRQHRSGATYLYTAAGNKPVSADWKEFSGKVVGFSENGTPSYRWWKGTKQAKILMILNYKTKSTGTTEFKDILVETID